MAKLALRSLASGLAASCALAAPAAIAGSAQAAGRIERMQADGVLRVCQWPGHGGMTWRDPRSGELKGLDADMARELARDLTLALDFHDSTMGELATALADERCDVAMSGIGVNRERGAQMRFTRPYLRYPLVAVASRHSKRFAEWSNLDQPGVRIAVLPGTAAEELARRYLRRATLVAIVPPANRERALEAGRIDAFLATYAPAAHTVRTNDWAQIVVPDQPVETFDFAYAVKPGDDAWAARVDRFVATIREDGRLARAAARHGLEAMLIGDRR